MSLAGVTEALKKRDKSGSGNSQNVRRTWVKLKDGESAIVRFLEQGEDFKTAWTHTYERTGVRKDGTSYVWFEEVLASDKYDYDDDGNAPRFKFWINVIWRDGPVFKTDDDGNIVRNGKEPVVDHREDIVAIYSGGITVAETLDELEDRYRGLMSRDFKITRKGSSKDDTKYKIEPVGEVDDEGNIISKSTPLSDNDKKLAKGKYDLDELKASLAPLDTEEAVNNRVEDRKTSNIFDLRKLKD